MASFAADLSIKLIKKWLVDYKFKDWSTHNSTGTSVTPEEKEERAEKIAQALNDQVRWGTHSRGINRDALTQLGFVIGNLEDDRELSDLVQS